MNNSDVNFKFNNKILHKLRKSKGLSQEKMAELVGVSRQTIYLWESGKSIPDIENVSMICQILDINTEKIVDGWKESGDNVNKNNRIKRLKKIMLIIFIMLILIYVISSMRKFIILQKISLRLEKIENLNNYSYICSSYNIENFEVKNFNKLEVYYKNNIMKSIYTSENNKNIVWIDYYNDKGYEFHEIEKEVREIDLNQQIYQNEKTLHDITFFAIGENCLINFIYSFNPFVKISVNDRFYIIENKTKILDSKWNIQQKIDKDTGITLSEIWYGENNFSKNKLYDVKIGETLDKEIIFPNVNDYTKN